MLHLNFEQVCMLFALSVIKNFIAMLVFALWQTDRDLKKSREKEKGG